MVAFGFGLTEDEFRDVVKQCDYPTEKVGNNEFARTLDTKGFWRFEKDVPPEERLAVLSQIALADLRQRGIDEFLSQNDGAGWTIPETLRLADHGLGHDDRAKEHQPVAAALGPRFYPWQLEQSIEESWEECERHAEILGRILPASDPEKKTPAEDGDAVPIDLFGNPIYSKSRKR